MIVELTREQALALIDAVDAVKAWSTLSQPMAEAQAALHAAFEGEYVIFPDGHRLPDKRDIETKGLTS